MTITDTILDLAKLGLYPKAIEKIKLTDDLTLMVRRVVGFVTVSASSSNVIFSQAHLLSVGQPIIFLDTCNPRELVNIVGGSLIGSSLLVGAPFRLWTTSSLPSPLTQETVYYVVSDGIALTPGGSAISIEADAAVYVQPIAILPSEIDPNSTFFVSSIVDDNTITIAQGGPDLVFSSDLLGTAICTYGDDSGNGSETAPFNTIDQAITFASGYDYNGHSINIQLAPGLYGLPISFSNEIPATSTFAIYGTYGAPEITKISGGGGHLITQYTPIDGALFIGSVTLTTNPEGSGDLINQQASGTIYLSNIEIGTPGSGSSVVYTNATGGSIVFQDADSCNMVNSGNSTFAKCDGNGLIQLGSDSLFSCFGNNVLSFSASGYGQIVGHGSFTGSYDLGAVTKGFSASIDLSDVLFDGHDGSFSLSDLNGQFASNFKLTLPTSDPHLVDAWWNDGGTIKVSAG